MTESNPEAVDPSQYDPDAQAGVEYQKPKDLNAAGPDHPMYQRVTDRGIAEEEGIDPEEGDTIPWNVPATILKHMSDSLYESDEATIREFIANGETATLRVENGDGNIVPDDYQPIVEVTYNAAKNKVVIQDNGIGIASATGVEVLRNIGVTTTRDTGSYSGQFGMGLASFLKLIGPMNSMIMQTRSRHTDENYAAYVNLGGFDPIEGGMPEGEYGTRFTMFPKDPDVDIQEAVEKYAEWLRVPVHYEEYDADNELVFDEDWGGKTFVDTYAEGTMETTIDEPGLFKATMSPDSQGNTLLLSMEIDRNDGGDGSTKTFEAPYKFDVRLYDESGAVVKCECDDADHTGMTPISDAEYQMREPERQRGHVPESELGPQDLTLPEPTSSRDRLQNDEDFWKWLSGRLDEKFQEECLEVFHDYDGLGDILNLRGRELDKVIRGTTEYLSYGRSRSLQEAIEEEFEVSLDGDACDVLKVMKRDISHAPRKKPGISVKSKRDSVKIHEVLNKSYPDGDVYMGVSLNQDKAKVVWDMDDDNHVVRVESSDKYPMYSRLFGWKELREISLNDLDQYDISDDLYEEITGEQKQKQKANNIDRDDPTPADEEQLNVSCSSRRRDQAKFQSDAIKSMFKNGEALDVAYSYGDVERLILFPANGDRKVSDHYWMAGEDGDTQTAVAKCNVKTWHYLKDLSQVYHADDFVEQSYNVEFDSSEGPTTVAESRDNLVCHIVSDENKSRFMDVADQMKETLPEYADNHTYPKMESRNREWPDDMVYAPITHDELWELRPALKEEGIMVVKGDDKASDVYTPKFKSDFRLYAYARLKDWPRDSTEFEVIEENVALRLDEGGFELIESLALAHDEGKEPYSEQMWV